MILKGRIFIVVLIIAFGFSVPVTAADTPAVMVGDTGYDSLPDALRAAPAYASVKLMTDAVWDEACNAVSVANGVRIESYDTVNRCTLSFAVDLYVSNYVIFDDLFLDFAEGSDCIFAQGYHLYMSSSVEMVGDEYPFVYGGGAQGEILGAALILEGGTYQGIYGGSAGAPSTGTPNTVAIYMDLNAKLAPGALICAGNPEAAYPTTWSQLYLCRIGTPDAPITGVMEGFTEITISGGENAPCYASLGGGDLSSYNIISLGNNVQVTFAGSGTIEINHLYYLFDVIADDRPVIVKNDESLLHIRTGSTGDYGCGVITMPGADGVYSSCVSQIIAPLECDFTLLSPSGYELVEGEGELSHAWDLIRVIPAPDYAEWSGDNRRISWKWTGSTDVISCFSLGIYKDGALYRTCSVPVGDGVMSYDLAAVVSEGGAGSYQVAVFAEDLFGGDGPAAWTGVYDYIPPETILIDGLEIIYEAKEGLVWLYPTAEQMEAILAAGRLDIPLPIQGNKGFCFDFCYSWIEGQEETLVLMSPYGYGILSKDLFCGDWDAETRCSFLLEKNGNGITVGLYKDGLPVSLPDDGTVLTLGLAFRGEMAEKENYIVCHGESDTIISQCVYDEELEYIHFLSPLTGSFFARYNAKYFTDLPDGAWYAKAMNYMTAREVVRGVRPEKASPDTNVSRADFLIMVMRSFDIPLEEGLKDNFVDAGDTYYTDYLATAKKLEIIAGAGNNYFLPKNEITREEMFKILYGVLLVLDRIEPVQVDISCYQDYQSIHSWALPAVMALHAEGDISGWNQKLFPAEKASRSHAVQILYNLLIKQVPELS